MTDADRAFDRYRLTRQPEDLAKVFDICAPQLVLFANHIARDPGAAEDLVQLTFLRAIEGVERFQPGKPVQPWLTGILVTETKKYHRQSGRKPDVDRLAEHGVEPVPQKVAEMHEFQAALTKALDELPQNYREVMTLRLVHGLTPTEIAHLRGVSPETVKTQLRRGTDKLRKLLPASFAAALIPLATTAVALAEMRAVVVEAAAEAFVTAGGVAAAATTGAGAGAGATVAAVATSAGTGSPASATPVLAKVATGRLVAGTLAAGGIIALGVFAFGAGGSPELPPVEERVEIPEREPVAKKARGAIADQKFASKAAVRNRFLASFTGTIVDAEDGLGAQNMQVDLLRFHAESLVADAATLPKWTTAPEFLAGSAQTDERGRFTISGVPPTGVLVLVVDSGGPRVDLRLLNRTPLPNEHVQLGELRIGKHHFVKARLLGPDLRPVVGARIQRQPTEAIDMGDNPSILAPILEQLGTGAFETSGALVLNWGSGQQVLTVPPWFHSIFERVRGKTATTDGDGRFEWVHPRTGPLTLQFFKPGFLPVTQAFDVRAREQDFGVVKMLPENRVTGLVVDHRGQVVKRAHVMLAPHDPEARCSVARAVAVTDAEGQFRGSFSWRSEVLAVVRAAEGEPWQVIGPMAPNRHMVLNLPQRFDLSIRVDMPTPARPVFRLIPGEKTETPMGVLGMHQLGAVEPLSLRGRREDLENGIVKLKDVPAGNWILMVGAPGHMTRSLAVRVDGDLLRTVELAEVESTDIEVEDFAFNRIAAEPVFARMVDERDAATELAVRLGRTNAEGQLQFARNRWCAQVVGIQSGGFGGCTLEVTKSVREVDFKIERHGVIEGVLTLGGVRAEAGSRVVVAELQPPPGRTVATLPPAVANPVVFCPVRENGQFRFRDLEPGKWRLRALPVIESVQHPSELLARMFLSLNDGTEKRVRLLAGADEEVEFEAEPVEAEEDAKEVVTRTTVHGTLQIPGRDMQRLKIGLEVDGRWRWTAPEADGSFDTGVQPNGAMRMVVALSSAKAPAGQLPEEYFWMKHVTFVGGPLATNGPQVNVNMDLHFTSVSMLSPRRDYVRGIEVTLEGALDGGAKTRWRRNTTQSGDVSLELPTGRYRVRAERPGLGWIDERNLEVQFALSTTLRMNPLLTAAGHALPGDIGVELPRYSKVEFVRVGGRHPVTKTVELVRGTFFQKERPFEVQGLLPGKYKVRLLPSIQLSERHIMRPEQAKIAVDQGTLEVGGGGARGLILRKKSPIVKLK